MDNPSREDVNIPPNSNVANMLDYNENTAVSQSTKQLGLRVRTPQRYQNITLSDYLTVVLPGDRDAAKRLQEANLHHSHQAECYDFGKKEIIAVSWDFIIACAYFSEIMISHSFVIKISCFMERFSVIIANCFPYPRIMVD